MNPGHVCGMQGSISEVDTPPGDLYPSKNDWMLIIRGRGITSQICDAEVMKPG